MVWSWAMEAHASLPDSEFQPDWNLCLGPGRWPCDGLLMSWSFAVTVHKGELRHEIVYYPPGIPYSPFVREAERRKAQLIPDGERRAGGRPGTQTHSPVLRKRGQRTVTYVDKGSMSKNILGQHGTLSGFSAAWSWKFDSTPGEKVWLHWQGSVWAETWGLLIKIKFSCGKKTASCISCASNFEG